jgi:hypothetical protein
VISNIIILEKIHHKLREIRALLTDLLISVQVFAITALGVPGGTFVSMNRFSTLSG